MSKASRDKGKRGERALATRLRDALPEFADGIKRGWQTRSGCDDADVCGLPGFWIESKCGILPNPRAALAQASADSKGRGIPLACIQDDRSRDRFVVLTLTDMLRILRSAYGLDAPLVRQ